MSLSGADLDDSQGAPRPSDDTEIDLGLNQEENLVNSKDRDSHKKRRSSFSSSSSSSSSASSSSLSSSSSSSSDESHSPSPKKKKTDGDGRKSSSEKKRSRKKKKKDAEKPPTVISCKVLRSQAKLAKLVMARGLQLAKVKLLRNKYDSSVPTKYSLNCPALDDTFFRRLTSLKSSSASKVNIDQREKALLALQFKILDIR
jgi:hypothetical protein